MGALSGNDEIRLYIESETNPKLLRFRFQPAPYQMQLSEIKEGTETRVTHDRLVQAKYLW